jgi:GrpB-like predicted nucleotidyltransferase (UPF0157 family)/predicted kinase
MDREIDAARKKNSAEKKMIIIINGPVGVGKTEVAWKLIEKFERAVMLDGDYLGALHPFEIYDERRVAYLYDTICYMARFHVEHGWRNLVVNYVFETPESLAQLRRALNEIDNATYAYRLTCEAEEISRRIRARNIDSDQLAWELKRFREFQVIQEENARRGDLGVAIDTTRLSSAAAADAIWRDITYEVTIVPYDPVWPVRYEEEREKIVAALGDFIMEIHHFGSTAVPDLPAKPIIDIMVAVRQLSDATECIGPLSDLGYAFIDYPQNTDRRLFRKGQPQRTHHVHIVAQGSAALREHLAFRDALRTNTGWRGQYAALKMALADRHRNDRAQYTESKTEFVRSVLSASKSMK